jgi:hypothetical protein
VVVLVALGLLLLPTRSFLGHAFSQPDCGAGGARRPHSCSPQATGRALLACSLNQTVSGVRMPLLLDPLRSGTELGNKVRLKFVGMTIAFMVFVPELAHSPP